MWQLWDGRSGRNVHTYKSAHNSQHVSSVQFSRNGKYVLSSGKDSICKLWDLSMPSNPIQVYTGADLSGNRQVIFVYIYSCFATLIYLDFDLCVHKFNWFKNRFTHWCWKYFFLIHTTGLLNMTILNLLLNLN